MADKSVFRSKDPVTMDVWGVCASRDIFGFHRDFHEDAARFILGKNFMACSFMSQFSGRNGPELTSDDLDLLKTEFRTMTAGVAIRSALADYNKTIPDQLRESGSEWLIIDGRTDSYGLTEIEYEDGTCDYISSKASFRYGIDEILIEKGFPHKMREIKPEEIGERYSRMMDSLVAFVKERYGDKVILNCSFESDMFIDREGCLKDFSQAASAERNAFIARFNRDFYRATGCYCIKTPLFQMADAYHKWGLYPVHYLEEHYRYMEKCLDAIVSGEDVNRRLDDLYMEYSALFASIRSGEVLSVKNSMERYSAMMSEGRKEEGLELLRSMVDQGIPQAMVEMGKLHADGTLGEKDMAVAEGWMRKAIDEGYSPALYDIFDLIWDYGSPDEYGRMVEMIQEPLKDGNRIAMLRMGRAYRYGKGVPKDTDKAAELFAEAARDKRTPEIREEYFDFLYSTGDRRFHRAMADSVRVLAIKGAPGCQARYGLC
ncbi:MAG: sel1 repeat family protein [Candidatus Methanomethylophilaceae archaeon]|nr:sel1 repeat family protein [Candidatus Methanomethylophilaceae archaeon]